MMTIRSVSIDTVRERGGTVVRIRFDGSRESWLALDTGRRWNGWIVPIVTVATRDAIATWLEALPPEEECGRAAAEIRACEPYVDTDRVTLDCGLTFVEERLLGGAQ